MKIIVISKSELEKDESELITSFFECGLQTLHLRKPKISTSQMDVLIKKIPKKYHNRIVIHSHHNLAAKYKLKGIHLTRQHRKQKWKYFWLMKWLRYRNPAILVTYSHNTLAGILDKSEEFNYVFLSPIFDSPAGKYQSGFSEYSLSHALTVSDKKVIARGGSTIDRIIDAHKLGFSGIAFYSSIWEQENPLQVFKNIIQKCSELGVERE